MTTPDDPRQRLLIISFSPIANDARVLKQIRFFSGTYDVTTCGYGPAPDGVAEHFSVRNRRLPWKTLDILLQVRAFRAAYWAQPTPREAWSALRGRRFDAIIANDIDTLPLALRLRPTGGVHSDLHEYWPRLEDQNPNWMKRFGAWHSWTCRTYLPRCASASTVSTWLADEYERQFGVPFDVITNATPYHDLRPTPVHDPIRLVHAGTSHRERNIETIVDAVEQLEGFTLDMYLTPNDPPHLAHLKERAQRIPAFTVHDPAPYDRLIETLNQYDVGVHLLPPRNFNFENTFPNKISDFAQARLAAVIGPGQKVMDQLVRTYHYGIITDGFTADDLVRALRSLTPESIAQMKHQADLHAHELSSEAQVPKWGVHIDAIMAKAAQRD